MSIYAVGQSLMDHIDSIFIRYWLLLHVCICFLILYSYSFEWAAGTSDFPM